MNKRAVIQVLIILILIILLAFGALAGLFKQRTAVRRINPKTGKVDTNVKLRADQTMLEEKEEASKAPPEENKAIVEAVSHSGWVNNGSYEVFGQVENVGNATARQVKAHVIFKDVQWAKVGETERLIDIPTLAPGAKSGFRVALKTNNPNQVRSYVLLFTLAPK